MGAFGRLLIQKWGGDLDTYNGNTQSTQPKYLNKSKEEILEEDKETFERVTMAVEDFIKRGEIMMSEIKKTESVSRWFKTKKYQKEFLKWRKQTLNNKQ